MTAPDPREAELVARARRGDREAFSTLVAQHASIVLTVAWRILGDRSLAEDVAQETFLAAFRGLSSFREDARLSTWLYRIAVNRCRDVLRARASRPEVPSAPPAFDGEPPPEPVGESPEHRNPEDLMFDRQRADAVSRAMRQLAPIYREAFVLRHVEGLSYDEMADVLGVDGGTLRMRVYKARRELSRDLAGLAVR